MTRFIYEIVNKDVRNHEDLRRFKREITDVLRNSYPKAQHIAVSKSAYGFVLNQSNLNPRVYRALAIQAGIVMKGALPVLGLWAVKHNTIGKYGKGKNFRKVTSKKRQSAHSIELWPN